MFKKKLTAIITAALLLGTALPTMAEPKGVYLKSKDGNSDEVIYINYNDFMKGYASNNPEFRSMISKYDVQGISVKTDKSKNVIDFKEYVADYNNEKGSRNVDEYSDKAEHKDYKVPDKVKQLHKDGKLDDKEIPSPDKEEERKDGSIAISEARQKSLDTVVTVSGVVTSLIGNNAFVQDNTGGIYIYLGPNENPNIKPGNKVKLTGPLAEFNGLKQIKSPTDITMQSEGNPLPESKIVTVSNISEEHQGMLVTLKGVLITDIGGPDKRGSYTVKGSDSTGSIDIRVDSFLDPKIDSSSFKVGSTIDITAALGKFHEHNQLMLSKIKDVTVTDEGDGTLPSVEGKTISEIQGKSHRSPLENQRVSGVKGIVTAISSDKYQKGFFMQNPNPDGDPATSEGIFVKYSNYSSIHVGDEVSVEGVVSEVVNGLQKDCVPETVLSASKVKVNSHKNKLPDPVVIKLNKTLAKNIDNDKLESFDIDEDAIDYYESIEGMRVQINNPQIVGADERYGEICVLANDGEFSEDQRTPYDGIKAYANDFNPEVITIDDVIKPIVDNDTKTYYDTDFEVSVGDKFKSSVVGVMSSGFGKYKVLNTEKLPEIETGKYNPEEKKGTSIVKDENKLTVASFNVENLSKLDTDRLPKIAKAIVNKLNSPDIVGLSEIQDNDGANDSGTVDASETYKALIAAIRDAGGPEYAYTDIAPANDQDGGIPGGNIRVGFIYKKDKVNLVSKPKGDATTSVAMTDSGLSVNPGRISPTHNAFNSSRKPLVAQFNYNGKDLFVIANHLNSKRGDGSLFGMNQPPIMGSQGQRHTQATLINNFVKDILNKQPDANIIALGDMNDYEFSETLDILKGNEMSNSVDKLQLNERYSYVYNGNSQILDNLLVSNNLYKNTEVDIVHINSQSTYEKLSDHDPILVQVDLGKPVELTAEQCVEKDLAALSLGDTSKVTDNLTLPTSGRNGTMIEWTSDNTDVVSNAGAVVRPEEEDVNVTLIATVGKDEVARSKKFTVTVKKKDEVPNNPTGNTEELINEGFDSAASTEGWDITNGIDTYTTNGNYGEESPSLKLKATGHTVTSPALKQSAKELSFWIKGNGTLGNSKLKIEGLVDGKWVEIDNLVLSQKAQTITYKTADENLPENVMQVRFVYTKAKGNAALDDVVIK